LRHAPHVCRVLYFMLANCHKGYYARSWVRMDGLFFIYIHSVNLISYTGVQVKKTVCMKNSMVECGLIKLI